MSSKLFNVYAESEYTFWTMNENDEYKQARRQGWSGGIVCWCWLLPCRTAHNAINTPECTHAEQSRAQWALAWTMNGRGVIQGETFLESFESLSPLHQTVAQTAGLQYWRRIQRFIYLAECGLSFWNGNMNREIWFCFCPNHATILVSSLLPPKL